MLTHNFANTVVVVILQLLIKTAQAMVLQTKIHLQGIKPRHSVIY